MSNITSVVFDQANEIKTIYNGLWQYDYGQILRIQGLNLPAAVEIHFSLQKTGGEAVRRIGVTKDGVTDVVIPDFILENEGIERDYTAYAFIYLSTEESGQTEHRIELNIKSRPAPEGSTGSDETSFGAIMDAIKTFAAGKADGLSYKNSILSLLAGENTIASVTIKAGEGTGSDAREIELQKSETAIQWRYVGDEEWTDLVLLTDLKGETGEKGDKGDPGEKGEAGEKGDTGDKGDQGEKGEPGTSVTHEWKGTILQITSASGTSEMDLKGEKGDQGEAGEKGDTGAKGDTGDKGDTGATGAKGENGIGIESAKIEEGHLKITYTDGNTVDAGEVTSLTQKIDKSSEDTIVEIEPNIFYNFPEMSTLTYTLAAPSDENVVNEYHFLFISGETATEVVHPESVNIGSFTVEANKIYEISIMENLLTSQSWAVS